MNKIQFNRLYINMWLPSLSIFGENQFLEIKRVTLHKKGKKSKNEQ